MKIRNAKLNSIRIEKFDVNPLEAWCVLGFNCSDLEDFFRLISGETGEDVQADQLDLPEGLGIVSFEKQQALYELELKKDDTDFLDKLDPGTLAGDFLTNPDRHEKLIHAFDMNTSMNKGYRQLSTGQSRKLMLLSQITKGISSLVIQSPYDGLDFKSRKELDRVLCFLHKQKNQLIVFVNNMADIPSWCTHLAVLSGGRLVHQGARQKVMDCLEPYQVKQFPDFQADVKDLAVIRSTELEKSPGYGHQTELVWLNNGFAVYGGVSIFKNLSLKINQGDHTLVTGPNGSGKSTLLQVITGDHPSCYQNDLRIFGVQRGTGESIWDLKQHMGIVSSDLHRNYRVPVSTLHCIISGLLDSIGLYRQYSRQQEQQALAWLDRMNMAQNADTPFQHLGYAGQRLVLVARALVKVPKLLILDEPTQGIDEFNRTAILEFLEEVAKEKLCTILYVSHREDEFRSFFRQTIQMG